MRSYFCSEILLVGLLSVCCVLNGCKATPARCQTEFLGNDKPLRKDPSRKAYNRVWVDPKISNKEWKGFTKVCFPCNDRFVPDSYRIDNLSLAQKLEICAKFDDKQIAALHIPKGWS